MFVIILLSCFSPLSFAQVNNNYNTRGIQKLHKINYKTPTTITIIKSISITALQFSAVHVWVVHVYVCTCTCTCISHRIMHDIIIIYKVMSYSAKFLRAINFTDFAVSLQNVKIFFCKNEQTASHVAKIHTVYWVYF